ncbi:MAG: histidinol-phosphate aminotransferase family protein [Saprospiraceae bacterium]|nr:histidinol-phosphate aminotransferase family protein [Saprospiraceae bacterium]
MNNLFFNDHLLKSESRISPAKSTARLFLDKNEQSDDVDFLFKEKVLGSLMDANWNRYPAAENKDIEALVANYCGLEQEHIVLGPGSASIITTLLNYFALGKKRIIIAQPTYTLFDYHCKTYNIEYEPWYLTSDLEYDYENIPSLDAGSVLVITTPNNPVGNTFDPEKLENILISNPDSFVIVDAVYTEFSETDFTPLVRQYHNLLVLRSFSKAFPIAGLRLGYLCAAPQTSAVIRKLMLMFSINHFSLVFAREVLLSPKFIKQSKDRVQAILHEREWMYQELNSRFDQSELKVYKSAGNFLLIRVFNDAFFKQILEGLEKNGIKVLNTSPFPLLRNTFRVSIGTEEENECFMECLEDSLLNNKCLQQSQSAFPDWIGEVGTLHQSQLAGSR